MYIGIRVKELRKKVNMPLQELAQKSGVQIATLSRIEHQKMSGTLDSHMAIAKALGVELTDLYTDIIREGKTVEVQTKRNTSEVFTHSENSSYEILTNNVLSKRMMPTLLKIEPAGSTKTEQNKPGSEKFIFVLDGKLEAQIGDEKHNLNKNNTLYFNASVPHSFNNLGKSTARLLCVATPVQL
jgi:transcriptional regulator with XRE-family HTH domain